MTLAIYLVFYKTVARRVPKIHIAYPDIEINMVKVMEHFEHDRYHFSILSFTSTRS